MPDPLDLPSGPMLMSARATPAIRAIYERMRLVAQETTSACLKGREGFPPTGLAEEILQILPSDRERQLEYVWLEKAREEEGRRRQDINKMGVGHEYKTWNLGRTLAT